MAGTRAGWALTEEHKQAQIGLGASFSASSRVLLGELDPFRLDATSGDWQALQLLLTESAFADSVRLAEAYMSVFRAVETSPTEAAGMPIVRPTFDAVRMMERVGVLPPMVKAATTSGRPVLDAIDQVFWELVAGWGREALAGGRRLVDESALANPASTGWRRVTDGNPCAWCAMLASRGPAYRSRETAGEGRRFHDRCGCTVEEVFGEWAPSAQERAFIDLYEASHKPGMSASEAAAAMRENGHGVLSDAHAPSP